jgi:phage tail tape-measure protein
MSPLLALCKETCNVIVGGFRRSVEPVNLMSLKAYIWFGMAVGSTVGSYVPVVLGADMFSAWSVIGSAVGGIAGIWAGFRIGNSYC